MRPPARRPANPAPPLPALYMSTATEGEIAPLLGSPHYSYHFAAGLFRALLARRAAPPRHLPMPESYPTAVTLNDSPPGAAPTRVHLIFRSTEQIRLLKPAVNIACFPWEFPVLKTDTLAGEHPFANQARMLGLCEEIWTPSTYAKDVLTAHGLPHVHRIPAPVQPAFPRLDRTAALRQLAAVPCVPLAVNQLWSPSHAKSRAEAATLPLGEAIAAVKPATIVLTILNPEDFRKNLDPLLRGFHQFRRSHPGCVLILKALTAERRFPLAEVASNVVPAKLDAGTVLNDQGILIVNQFLTDEAMAALYSLADFYLCTSIGEGQNLPLIEAMAYGTVALSPRTTAMLDYIDAGNAHIIPTQIVANRDPHLAGTLAARPFRVDICNAAAVRDTLAAAHAEPAAKRAIRARAGRKAVAAAFGADQVWSLIEGRLMAHAGGGC